MESKYYAPEVDSSDLENKSDTNVFIISGILIVVFLGVIAVVVVSTKSQANKSSTTVLQEEVNRTEIEKFMTMICEYLDISENHKLPKAILISKYIKALNKDEEFLDIMNNIHYILCKSKTDLSSSLEIIKFTHSERSELPKKLADIFGVIQKIVFIRVMQLLKLKFIQHLRQYEDFCERCKTQESYESLTNESLTNESLTKMILTIYKHFNSLLSVYCDCVHIIDNIEISNKIWKPMFNNTLHNSYQKAKNLQDMVEEFKSKCGIGEKSLYYECIQKFKQSNEDFDKKDIELKNSIKQYEESITLFLQKMNNTLNNMTE